MRVSMSSEEAPLSADRLNPETRSRVMAAIRGSENKTTERRMRGALAGAGLRGYSVRNRSIFGSPDFAFVKPRIAVFVDGCFWHGCPTCGGNPPVANRAFWEEKITRNRARDTKVNTTLISDGWAVLRFWEHRLLADLEGCVKEIGAALDERKARPRPWQRTGE